MRKHTPGRVEYSTNSLRSIIADCSSNAVCEEHGTSLANVQLIAAAPELLSALHEFVQLSNNLAVALTAEQVAEAIQYITIHCHVARAAIAKAAKA